MGRRGGPWGSVSSLPQSKSGTSPAPGANFCLCPSCLPMNWSQDTGLTACARRTRCRNPSGSGDSPSWRPCTPGRRGQQVALQARSGGAAGVPRWDPPSGPRRSPGERLAAWPARLRARGRAAPSDGVPRQRPELGDPCAAPLCFKQSAQPPRGAPAGGRTWAQGVDQHQPHGA